MINYNTYLFKVRDESGCKMLLFYIASFILYGFYVIISKKAIEVLTLQRNYFDSEPEYIIGTVNMTKIVIRYLTFRNLN